MQRNRIDGLRDLFAGLKEQIHFTRQQVVILGLLAAISVAGGLLAAQRTTLLPLTAQRGRTAEEASAPANRDANVGLAVNEDSSSLETGKKRTKDVIVHVAGDVVNPGIQKIKAGSRVGEAVEAAGGPLDKAALNNLNLAAKVQDGQKILVRMEIDLPLEGASADTASLLSINTAGPGELEKLDGVGPVLAKRIIAWREEHGGFTSISQLKDVSGIGPKKYTALKDQVLLY